jgi:hypothetical protein
MPRDVAAETYRVEYSQYSGFHARCEVLPRGRPISIRIGERDNIVMCEALQLQAGLCVF